MYCGGWDLSPWGGWSGESPGKVPVLPRIIFLLNARTSLPPAHQQVQELSLAFEISLATESAQFFLLPSWEGSGFTLPWLTVCSLRKPQGTENCHYHSSPLHFQNYSSQRQWETGNGYCSMKFWLSPWGMNSRLMYSC